MFPGLTQSAVSSARAATEWNTEPGRAVSSFHSSEVNLTKSET
jgi:hypothetical protein